MKFRPDLEGLRGVAVIAVILYHAGVPGFSGGFVGVDVFFVLSGYLITRLLVEEHKKSGRISFGGFYSRRVRRLLPASAMTFVGTILLVRWLMPPAEAIEVYDQSWWVALFASNIWFARDATDYLGSTVVSPFQQYWSLAVEEQFYLIWPLLVALLIKVRRVAIGIGVVIVTSSALAVVWTSTRQPWAFFLLPARAWELAAGGLLAVLFYKRAPQWVGWVGLTAILLAVVTYSERIPFPGASATLPVVGTLAVLSADLPILHIEVLGWFGKYSYGIYLWHWPLLVTVEAYSPLGIWMRLVIVAISIVIAVLSFELVEHRVRYSTRLRAFGYRNAMLGIGLIAIMLASTTIISPEQLVTPVRLDSGRPPVPAGQPSSYVPIGMKPDLFSAGRDVPDLTSKNCEPDIFDDTATSCPLGDPNGSTRVVLVGDSHARQWVPAIEGSPWNAAAYIKTSCAVPDISYEVERLDRRYTECERWRAKVIDEIVTNPPDVVIIGQFSEYYMDLVGERVWYDALAELVERLSEVTQVVVLNDGPWNKSIPKDAPISYCLQEHLDDVQFCAPDPTKARQIGHRQSEVVAAAGGRTINVTDLVCDTECPLIVGDILIWSDAHHLTATYVDEIGPEFENLVERSVN